MFKGGLVTFKIRDSEIRYVFALSEINIELKEEGIMLINKVKDVEVGYIEDIIGIDFDEFMNLFGYDKISD